MTRDEIIRMAEDCGISHRYYEIPVSKRICVVTVESFTHRLCQFAELIAQQEREACAKLMETHKNLPGAGMGYGAELIRTRKEK